jgi:hypothetical protein
MQLFQSRLIEQLETRRLFANPHFISGPTYTTSDTSVEATGTIAGIGNQDLTVSLTATGTATTTAINPAGKANPGHSGTVTATGSETIASPQNGQTTFDVTATIDTSSNKGGPNSKWTVNTTVQWQSATLIVTQDGQQVLTDTTTF